MDPSKRGLMERLTDGVMVGDGSFVITMEKRGYATAGVWTPEACVLHPDAVRQLHREFLRAGADVMQTFTFYSSEDRLECLALTSNDERAKTLTADEINAAAVDLARGVAQEGGALVAGSVSPLSAVSFQRGKEYSQTEFRKQMAVYKEKGVDFLLGEVEEAEWAIEAMAEVGVPVACTMAVPPGGDRAGVSVKECAVRMAKAGAVMVGVNCQYDPTLSLKAIALMKEGLEEAGLKTYLMVQPYGFHTQDPGMETENMGAVVLPEIPYSMEPRALTRIDVHHFARKAFEMGVRYIGGCCGFEPYHIRAIAEELAEERGRGPPCAGKLNSWDVLKLRGIDLYNKRATWEYWDKLIPSTGRQINTFSHKTAKL